MHRPGVVFSVFALWACTHGHGPDDVSTPPRFDDRSPSPPAAAGTYEIHNDTDEPLTIAVYEPPPGLCLASSLEGTNAPLRVPYDAAITGPPTPIELQPGAYATAPLHTSTCNGEMRTFAVFASSLDDGAYLALASRTITVSGPRGVFASGRLLELERTSTCVAPLRAATGALVLPPGPHGSGVVDAVRFEGSCVVLDVAGVGAVQACNLPRWPFAATEALTATAAEDDVRVESPRSQVRLLRVRAAQDPRLGALGLAIDDGGADCGTLIASQGAAASCVAVARDVQVAPASGAGDSFVTGVEREGSRALQTMSTLVTDAVEYPLRSACQAATTRYDVGIVQIDTDRAVGL